MTAIPEGLVLADTSALARLARPGFGPLRTALEEGRVAICDQVAMELLWTARDARDLAQLEAELAACPWLRVAPEDWDAARRTFRALAADGPLRHRRVPLPDLLIAAVAHRHAVPVVHYDADFETIAGVTGQPVAWAVPRGSA